VLPPPVLVKPQPVLTKPPGVIPDPIDVKGSLRIADGQTAVTQKMRAEAVAAAPAGTIARSPILTGTQISPVTLHRLTPLTSNPSPPTRASRPPDPPAPRPGPAPGTPQPASDNVSILAFICTQLPKCPDPDPTLTW